MKLKTVVSWILCCAVLSACGQPQDALVKRTDIVEHGLLPDELTESSGMMITRHGSLIGHNDSGFGPVLYEFSLEGNMIRKIEVNASSIDWEDMASDEEHIYIADTGNNRGKRKDLAIHKVALPKRGKDDIKVESVGINVKYGAQVDFSKQKKHNFDCEALVSIGDSLYMFSKNREDKMTNVYAVSKSPGDYTLSSQQTFDVNGLVTGADYQDGTLVLIGYKKKKGKWHPFIWTFWDFEGTDFFGGKSNRVDLPYTLQTETIVITENQKSILFTNEEEEKGDIGKIYEIPMEILKG